MKKKLLGIILMITAICLVAAAASAGTYATVEEAVTGIMAEMNAAGITGEYNQAVWLHDWLTMNANYDYSYQWYDPAGVLLHGTGVCESYTSAYALLLNQAGIENATAVSASMNHTWNLVKLDGEWCHVDVTWDDPDEGGLETHFYFGMNDNLISRDHVLESSPHICTSIANYYPLRHNDGALVFSSKEEMIELLETVIQDQPPVIELYYIGSDPAFSVVDEFVSWHDTVYNTYGLLGYSVTYGNYNATFSLQYTDPWETTDPELEEPVPAPSFATTGPAGTFKLSNYAGNGMVLVFGRQGCMNTQAFLRGFSGEVEGLNSVGVEVLVSVIDSADPEDIFAMEEQFPGYQYVYDYYGVMRDCLVTVGYDISHGITFPCIFLINSSGQIIDYSTGYVNNLNDIIAKSFSLGTGNKLPEPEHPDPNEIINGNGNVNDLNGSTIISGIQSALGDGKYVVFLSNGGIEYNNMRSYLGAWENKYRLYEALGIKLVVSFASFSDEIRNEFPHITFVDYSEDDFWPLLFNAGFNDSSASWLCNYFYGPDGNCIAYSNGSTLSLNDCGLLTIENARYDMAVPSGLVSIEEEAFTQCDFRNADLTAGSLERIGAGAFANSAALRLVKIPGSVTEIGDNAFSGCENVIIICPGNSAACKYAVRNGLLYLNR